MSTYNIWEIRRMYEDGNSPLRIAGIVKCGVKNVYKLLALTAPLDKISEVDELRPGSRKALKAGIYALTEQLIRAAIPIEP